MSASIWARLYACPSSFREAGVTLSPTPLMYVRYAPLPLMVPTRIPGGVGSSSAAGRNTMLCAEVPAPRDQASPLSPVSPAGTSRYPSQDAVRLTEMVSLV